MTTINTSNSISIIAKAQQKGFSYLSDSELLSLFMTNKRGVDTLDTARKVLRENEGLYFTLSTNPQNSGSVDGLTERELIRIQAARELALRASMETLQRGDALSSPERVREFLSLQLSGLYDEAFCVLFLDNRHRVLNFEVLFKGTIDGASVHPRVVVRKALICNSAALILAHNHPSGVAEPSEADIAITRKLTDACSLIDTRILDHIIVGQGVMTSMAERGMI